MNEKSLLRTGTLDVENVTGDITFVRTLIANVCFVGDPFRGDWVLIDTGLESMTHLLEKEAMERFGRPPKSIILTHGHFDHVGGVMTLSDRFEAPVYAHPLELPFLTGQQDYPLADPAVGGGLMAEISPLYPHKAIDLKNRVHPLPSDGSVPNLPDWRWIHTPGHSPGHISLYREADGALIAGDAFITVRQESALAVISQKMEINGPPAYFTPDWEQAKQSVQKLAALRPQLAVTGHGQPVSGDELVLGLSRLADNFDELAVPEQGRYVDEAGHNEE
ncbi:MBL fold metallo-hydrolase [Paenibacillus sp. YPG26]|uniref:MBL fold metallo-hydrolase n=1 Tax=Paenibacillus sp. YPG26 TaxID=2878915 RepID=UPI002041E19A|nr:MBL fold metallo-hydrolase [Paenibacillus sp. YPG26]USB34839.1 MBL fold metallo-hydrolase [Paenibacillus sp. YPG26]